MHLIISLGLLVCLLYLPVGHLLGSNATDEALSDPRITVQYHPAQQPAKVSYYATSSPFDIKEPTVGEEMNQRTQPTYMHKLTEVSEEMGSLNPSQGDASATKTVVRFDGSKMQSDSMKDLKCKFADRLQEDQLEFSEMIIESIRNNNSKVNTISNNESCYLLAMSAYIRQGNKFFPLRNYRPRFSKSCSQSQDNIFIDVDCGSLMMVVRKNNQSLILENIQFKGGPNETVQKLIYETNKHLRPILIMPRKSKYICDKMVAISGEQKTQLVFHWLELQAIASLSSEKNSNIHAQHQAQGRSPFYGTDGGRLLLLGKSSKSEGSSTNWQDSAPTTTGQLGNSNIRAPFHGATGLVATAVPVERCPITSLPSSYSFSGNLAEEEAMASTIGPKPLSLPLEILPRETMLIATDINDYGWIGFDRGNGSKNFSTIRKEVPTSSAPARLFRHYLFSKADLLTICSCLTSCTLYFFFLRRLTFNVRRQALLSSR